MIVKMFQLISGTTVVAEEIEEDGVRLLKSPFEFIFSPAGAGLIPYMAMAKGHVIPYPKSDHIMFICLPADNLCEEYKKAVNPSAITKVEKPGLLLPGS